MLLRALIFTMLAASPVLAAEQVYSLSPAAREAAIAAAAQGPESTALLPDPNRDRILGSSLYGNDVPRDNKVHGEVSMFVGTGGARGIAATIGAPIGDRGYAQFSFSQGRDTGQFYNPYGIYQPYRWDQQRR